MPRKRGKKGAKVPVKPTKGSPWVETAGDELDRMLAAKGWTSASLRIEHRMARLGIDPLEPGQAKGPLARTQATGAKKPRREPGLGGARVCD